MTYKNATKHITLEDAVQLYEELDVAVVIDEGQHVTFIDEISVK